MIEDRLAARAAVRPFPGGGAELPSRLWPSGGRGSGIEPVEVWALQALLMVVNLDRFNAAFGIASAGFSEGMVCVPPDRPAGERMPSPAGT